MARLRPRALGLPGVPRKIPRGTGRMPVFIIALYFLSESLHARCAPEDRPSGFGQAIAEDAMFSLTGGGVGPGARESGFPGALAILLTPWAGDTPGRQVSPC